MQASGPTRFIIVGHEMLLSLNSASEVETFLKRKKKRFLQVSLLSMVNVNEVMATLQ